jgi:hypothetical protein
MLVTSAYFPVKGVDSRRADVSNEVNGVGYSPGGANVAVSVYKDSDHGFIDVTLGAAEWPLASISANGAVYYKSRGGSSGLDELIAYIDFGGAVSSRGGLFSLTASTLRLHN